MPLFQCLKTCLTLLVDLVGIPAMIKDDVHNTYKKKMGKIYPYISSFLCASNRSNFMTGEKLPKGEKKRGIWEKKIFFRVLGLDFGADKW